MNTEKIVKKTMIKLIMIALIHIAIALTLGYIVIAGLKSDWSFWKTNFYSFMLMTACYFYSGNPIQRVIEREKEKIRRGLVS